MRARPVLVLAALAPPLASLLAGCLPSPLVHPRADEELRRGYRHLASGDTERAEVAFEHALEFAPDLPEGWNGLGVVARANDDARLAADRFAHAVELAPGFAEGHANLGEALLSLGLRDDAIGELRAALAIDPDLPGARQNLARALLHRGLELPAGREADWAAARREYLHLLEADPGSAAAHADLAWLDFQAGRFDRAASGYREAAGREPTPARLHDLCATLVLAGRCAEARDACRRCLAIDPDSAACLTSRRGADRCTGAAAPK